jgi:GAF domain-containing protein
MTATLDNAVADLRRTIAELQRQLDERTAERDEALEQQTATAEVLQVINSSPGDLAPVFDAMLEKATRLCNADFGILWSFDGELATAGALHRVPTAYAEMIRAPFRPSPESGPARMMRGDDTFVVPDLLEFPPYHTGDTLVKALVDLGGARTVVIAPLRKDALTIGAITIYRQEVRSYTDKQIALLENFAAQAVIAMENARLLTETREALEQQTATAEVLQVINSSPGDIAPVFEAILEKATRLCEAAFGLMSTYDGEQYRTVATHGVDPELAEFMRAPPHPDPDSALGRIQLGEDLVLFDDIADTDVYRKGDPRRRAIVDLGGAHSYAVVALRKDRRLLGIIAAYRREVRPFSDKQIALLDNFAAQAVIAMENARLITETREALEQQTATADVLQVINSSPGDLAPVFDVMLDKATRLCEAAFGVLSVVPDAEHVVHRSFSGRPEVAEFLLRGLPVRPGSRTTMGRLLAGENCVHVPDAKDDDLYRSGDPGRRRMVDLAGARTIISLALRKDAALLGAISLYRQEVRPFSDKEIALLQNFVGQAVIAMENSRLITETREALEQQTATSEVLQVINSSPGDLTPVFDVILDKAHTLCGAEYGVLLTYDGERFRVAAMHGTSWASAETLQYGIRPGFGFGRLLHGERFLHIHDMAEVAAQIPDDPLPRALFEIGGIRTQLAVPLRKDDRLLGIITANRREVRPFTDKQITLLENFAAQAVIAMENARLLGELRQRTDEIAGWNRELEERVAAQLAELERTGRLRRFLAPQLADLIVAQGDERILESHRREIVVVFCDLRGFTGFAERAEPEEVMALLRDYHAAMGPIVASFEGTLDHYAGDGIMVFFNDPVPTPDPARRAIDMAVAMRAAAQDLLRTWRRHGHDIGFGVGISQGYATLGQIGFAERMDYTAIGTVTNLAARLCAEAKDGQILVSRRVAIAVEDSAKLEEIGDLSLKGLSQAVAVYNVVAAAAEASAS